MPEKQALKNKGLANQLGTNPVARFCLDVRSRHGTCPARLSVKVS
jgi:hypothetical protein